MNRAVYELGLNIQRVVSAEGSGFSSGNSVRSLRVPPVPVWVFTLNSGFPSTLGRSETIKWPHAAVHKCQYFQFGHVY